MASAHLQRWTLSYIYRIKHKSGKSQGNADALICLPLLQLQYQQKQLLSFDCWQQTDHDPILCMVKWYTQHCWPDQLSSQDTDTFFHRKSKLSLEDGIML